ncbi:AAA family ATPase [Streptomyces sp. NPDC059443]|uniref:AAA family ATPase n=1 Tax=unclassified Streptomyces TaxID=2593676 RepID=UPI0036AEB03C
MTGTPDTRLIVLRGNSASGKSSVAEEIRDRHGSGIALVGQDTLRRVVLRERDTPGAANIGLIGSVARYALDHGFHVIVEGILYADRYGPMLDALRRAHRGRTHFYYLDVPFEETVRRHAGKPRAAAEYGEVEMREWYRPLDLLSGDWESIVGAADSLEDTVARVMEETGLSASGAAG